LIFEEEQFTTKGTKSTKGNSHPDETRREVSRGKQKGAEGTRGTSERIRGERWEADSSSGFQRVFSEKYIETFTLEQMNEIRRLFNWLGSHLK